MPKQKMASFIYASKKLTHCAACKKHILLVEDNPLLQHIHSLWLKDLDYAVTVVDSGAAALAEVLADYDAVLMDLDLPDDNGVSLTKKLKAKNPKLTIPVIACTTYDEAEMKATCLSSGMVDYLQKPISPARLAHSLKTHLA